MRLALTTLLTLALMVAFAGLARADASPFPGPPETCTETKKEQPGTDCEVCSIDYTGDDDSAQSCDDQFDDSEFRYVCTSGDWPAYEVWCDGPPRDTACSLDPSAAPSAIVIGVSSLLAALGIAVVARRRS